ncbi:hypothetical protein GTV32_17520 [Gordonia sp. SID5947]|uniref:hypothetical protein n=1 Tax=Gordonia sp. SID5947 TaxID=2690315 RepID=UPI00136A4F79|nr:hypothetical protein [Gordonia sp. SID5947]MYR07986.1 hypothetical protein [Gordonia sp. SID5947]
MSAENRSSEGQILDPVAVQDALVRALRDYAAVLEDHPELQPFRDEDPLTQTEAAIAASRLLDCAQIEFFELAMFDSLHTLKTQRGQSSL